MRHFNGRAVACRGAAWVIALACVSACTDDNQPQEQIGSVAGALVDQNLVEFANEPTIAINPTNDQNIATAVGLSIRVSTNGGATFANTQGMPLPPNYGGCGDPSLAFDSTGRLFMTYLGCIRPDPTNPNLSVPDVFVVEVNNATGAPIGAPANVSDQAGRGATTRISPGGCFHDNDKQWIAADRFAASPNRDNVYVAWHDLCAGHMVVSRSTDNGVTWSPAVQVSTAAENGVRMIHIAAGADGAVYVAYHSQPRAADGTEISDGTTGRIVFLRSDDGGQTFPAANQRNAFDPGEADLTPNIQFICTGTNCSGGSVAPRRLPGNQNLQLGSWQPFIVPDPTNAQRVAIVANDDPTNTQHGAGFDEASVFIVRSTDRGGTWSDPAQVDAGGGTSLQLMPSASADINSACLAVSYYDSRRGLVNGNNNALLDLIVRHSADFGATFGPEIRISDAAFDPDLNAPVYGGTPSPAPTGFIPTLRMGEYNGVLVARGAVWTGQGPAAAGLPQTMIFDYSDGIAPTVSAPAPISTTQCTPINFGNASAQDNVCGIGLDSVTVSAVGPGGVVVPLTPGVPAAFRPGTTTITWRAEDRADNVQTATQTVTVTDVTPPVISTPAAATATICTQSGTVTLTPPRVTDNCATSIVPSGTVISKNGVALSPPIPVVGGQVTLEAGVYVVRWTASDGFNSVSVNQTVTVIGGFVASSEFLLRDRARVTTVGGSWASIGNTGTLLTELGVEARSASILSEARVTLNDRANVQGNVTSESSILRRNGVIVSGLLQPFTPVTLPPIPDLSAVVWPAPGANRTFNPTPSPVLLAPGSYGNVTLNSGAVVRLSAGDYYFTDLTANSASLQIDDSMGEVRVFVRNTLNFRGLFQDLSGATTDFFLGYNGSANAIIEAPFVGRLVAPNGRVTFGTGTATQFRGQFYARGIEIRPDVTLICDPTVG